MSNTQEIKRRLDRIKELGEKMKQHTERFKGPEGEELKKKTKKEGTRLAAGIGTSLFGLMVAGVAGLYVLAVIILLVDLGLKRPWLSALIVVGGFLLIGGVIIAAGAGVASSSAKQLSKATEDVTRQMKQTGMEIKAEADELQKLLKQEAEERHKQVTELVETAKTAAPVAGPALAVAWLVFRLIKRRMRHRRENRAILRVIELYEARREEEEIL